MERVLYNGFGAAIATGGQRFFYVNPLQRREDHFEKDDPGRRRVWFNCACRPPNIMRLIASLEHYLATESGDTLYIHQYTGSRLSGAGLDLEVTTDYPWSGAVYLCVLAAPQAGRGLALRVPAWSATTRISVNHDPERTGISPGYHLLHRTWRAGDLVTVHLDATPRWTYPDRRVDAVRGCVAIERGPLVYCFEQADQLDGARLEDLAVRPGGVLGEGPVTLDGIGQTIEITAPAVPPPLPPRPPPRSPLPSQGQRPSRSRISSGRTATAARCASGCPAVRAGLRRGIPGRAGRGARRPAPAGPALRCRRAARGRRARSRRGPGWAS